MKLIIIVVLATLFLIGCGEIQQEQVVSESDITEPAIMSIGGVDVQINENGSYVQFGDGNETASAQNVKRDIK